MNTKGSGEQKSYESPGPGTFFGRIIGIFDLGDQPPAKEGEAWKPNAFVHVELLGKARDSEGNTFKVGRFFQPSNNSNSWMMKTFIPLMGWNFTFRSGNGGSVWYDLPDNFEEELFRKALHMPVMVSLVPKTNDPTRPFMESLAPVPDGFEVPVSTVIPQWLNITGPTFTEDWATAPDFIKKMVLKSKQMAQDPNAGTIGRNADAPQQVATQQKANTGRPDEGYIDDIPGF